jgi:hypothetical protein
MEGFFYSEILLKNVCVKLRNFKVYSSRFQIRGWDVPKEASRKSEIHRNLERA